MIGIGTPVSPEVLVSSCARSNGLDGIGDESFDCFYACGSITVSRESQPPGRRYLIFRSFVSGVGESTPREAALVTKGNPETILLVEDEPNIRETLQECLQASGYTVLVAENGRDALTTLEARAPISWMVSDVLMPGITGLELAHQAHARWPTLRIVLMSGSWDSTQEPEGPWQFLAKPFRLVELLLLLEAPTTAVVAA